MSEDDERIDLLIGFLEDELDAEEREQVEARLGADPGLEEALAGYRGLAAALSQLEAPIPSTDARDRASAAVLAAMAASGSAAAPEAQPAVRSDSEHHTSARLRPAGQLVRFLPAAAAAGLLVCAGLFALQSGALTSRSGIHAEVASGPAPESKVSRDAEAPLAGAAERDAEGLQASKNLGGQPPRSEEASATGSPVSAGSVEPDPSARLKSTGDSGSASAPPVPEPSLGGRAEPEELGGGLGAARPELKSVEQTAAELSRLDEGQAAGAPPHRPGSKDKSSAPPAPAQAPREDVQHEEPSPADDHDEPDGESARAERARGARSPSDAPSGAGAEGATEFSLRDGRRQVAKALDPAAWIVARGESQRLYVLAGQSATVRSVPRGERLAAAPEGSPLRVVALKKPPASVGLRPVDLDRRTEREDLVAIARYELAMGERAQPRPAESAGEDAKQGRSFGGARPGGGPDSRPSQESLGEQGSAQGGAPEADAAGADGLAGRAARPLSSEVRLRRVDALLRVLQDDAEVKDLREALRKAQLRQARHEPEDSRRGD